MGPDALIWVMLPVFIAAGSALLSFAIMHARMEVALGFGEALPLERRMPCLPGRDEGLETNNTSELSRYSAPIGQFHESGCLPCPLRALSRRTTNGDNYIPEILIKPIKGSR